MQDIAGSDRKIQALVHNKFDECRIAVKLPEKKDIKARLKKNDKLSLKYKQCEDDISTISVKRNVIRKDILKELEDAKKLSDEKDRIANENEQSMLDLDKDTQESNSQKEDFNRASVYSTTPNDGCFKQ